MKIHDCVQGTTLWQQLRSGIPTASEFDRIITPGGAASKSAERFMCALLAERLMGHPRLEVMSEWMRRGKELEAQAAASYEFQHDVETVPVGFITNDSETAGASPDRLVGDKGLLEIKCPSEEIHVAYLLQAGAAYDSYRVQCQGQLFIAEREWTDVISYHPEMPKAMIRIERDEKFIAKLEPALNAFCEVIEKTYAQMVALGWARTPAPAPPKSISDLMRESLIEIQS